MKPPNPTYCGCETIRHFDTDNSGKPIPLAGHPYGEPSGPTKRLNVPYLAGEPFCEECRRECWPDYANDEYVPCHGDEFFVNGLCKHPIHY